MYIYVNNNSNSANRVYFDDLSITHLHSPFVAGGDYYPYGLAMEDRQITIEPYRYGYQGQYAEKDSVTGWNSFELRMYDARFGRWLSPDPYGQYATPYVGMGNIPNIGVDADGGYLLPFSLRGAAVGALVGVAISLAFGEQDHWYWYALGGAAVGGFLASDYAKVKIWHTHYEAGLANSKYGNNPSMSRRDIVRPYARDINVKYDGKLFLGSMASKALIVVGKKNVEDNRPTNHFKWTFISQSLSDDKDDYTDRNAEAAANQISITYKNMNWKNVKITLSSGWETRPKLHVQNIRDRLLRKGIPDRNIKIDIYSGQHSVRSSIEGDYFKK